MSFLDFSNWLDHRIKKKHFQLVYLFSSVPSKQINYINKSTINELLLF